MLTFVVCFAGSAIFVTTRLLCNSQRYFQICKVTFWLGTLTIAVFCHLLVYDFATCIVECTTKDEVSSQVSSKLWNSDEVSSKSWKSHETQNKVSSKLWNSTKWLKWNNFFIFRLKQWWKSMNTQGQRRQVPDPLASKMCYQY